MFFRLLNSKHNKLDNVLDHIAMRQVKKKEKKKITEVITRVILFYEKRYFFPLEKNKKFFHLLVNKVI